MSRPQFLPQFQPQFPGQAPFSAMARTKTIATALTNGGFTLVELLVVVTITTIMLLAISSFFLAIVVSNNRSVFEQRLKNDGDRALIQMMQHLRNARSISSTCTTGLTSLSFVGVDNLTTTLTASSGKIASISSITNPTTTFYLTSDFSQLSPANTITFDCYTGENDQKYLEISFTLKHGTDAANAQNTLIRSFKTGQTLRN
ncbi:MAG TPA: hypothetical protein DEP87_01780 [Candidatus Pacebacteria bacterium]|nr:hypothetical protein [Candidatus Paceibacterota bacterium]